MGNMMFNHRILEYIIGHIHVNFLEDVIPKAQRYSSIRLWIWAGAMDHLVT